MGGLPLAWRPGLVAVVVVLLGCAAIRPSSIRRTGRRLARAGALAAQVAGELIVLGEHRVTRWCRSHRRRPLRWLGVVTDVVDRRIVRRSEAFRARATRAPRVRRAMVAALVAAAFTPSAAWLAMDHWPHTAFARSTRGAFDRWSTLERQLRLSAPPAVAAEEVAAPVTTAAALPALEWFVPGAEVPQVFGQQGDVPAPADLDAGGATLLAVFRPTTGAWLVAGRSGGEVLGEAGDVPVPADYRGVGHAQVAVFRPSTGEWLIDGVATPVVLGDQGDIPVPGAYTTAGVAQPAVYRPATGTWLVAGAAPLRYGEPGDIPVPADYDGDGRVEPAVFRPSTGEWWISTSARGPTTFGGEGDVPVPAAYFGATHALVAVYRPDTGELAVIDREPVDTGTTEGVPLVVRRHGQVTLAVVRSEP